MQQESVDVARLSDKAESLRVDGPSVMYLAANGDLLGLLAVSDPIKTSTQEALDELKAAGIRVIMATGDGVSTDKDVVQRLGIDEFHGDVKPGRNLELVHNA